MLPSDHEIQEKHTNSWESETFAFLVISFAIVISYTSIGWSDD